MQLLTNRGHPMMHPVHTAYSGDAMAIYFRTSINDAAAFERIDACLSGGQELDGYFNIYGADEELTLSWTRGMSADAFRQEIVDALRSTWDKAPYWAVYDRADQRSELDTNDIRGAAIRLVAGYPGALVVTLSLLGRTDSLHDLELIFVCFQQDTEARNFRVRYEGKFIPA